MLSSQRIQQIHMPGMTNEVVLVAEMFQYVHISMFPVVLCTARLHILCSAYWVTNLSVQTMKTSIWVIGSTSKGYVRLGNFTIWTCPWIGQSHFCKSPLPPLCAPPLGCWSDGPDWSFYSLHGVVGLHLICSLHIILNSKYSEQYPLPTTRSSLH